MGFKTRITEMLGIEHPIVQGGMQALSFVDAVKAKPGETVWFSFIVFRSKKHRDQVNAKVMKDPLMNDPSWADKEMPLDMKRFYYGGFTVAVGA
ncbi:MAG: DUF1428 family protein [Candidatus Doudnabacteria bacterium]|nr:DUF1428 family protein [Candidatus Doudnabacteria bacterium]